ncbi:MAG: TlpA family protein disulfide reductase [Bacillota bacterium]
MSARKVIAGILAIAAVFTAAYFYFWDDSAGNLMGKEKISASPAPDFTLVDLNGKEVRLSDFRGKKVLVNFWATWCTPCRQEMPLLQEFHEKAGGKDWQVLTVNITSTEKSVAVVQQYVSANNYTFPVLLDQKGAIAALYSIRGIPASFILNEKGEVVKTKVGPFTESEMNELEKLK